jgi:hypothetical protein
VTISCSISGCGEFLVFRCLVAVGWSVSGSDKFLVAVDKFWRGIFGESGLYFLIIILSQFWFGVVGLLQFLFIFFGVVGLSQFLSGCRNIFLVLLGCCNSCDFSALSIIFLWLLCLEKILLFALMAKTMPVGNSNSGCL